MATVSPPNTVEWTAADLVDRFGPIPLYRIVMQPKPGTATLEDVVRLDAEQSILCELFDGVLVEKAVGAHESFLAGQLITLLNSFLAKHRLGIGLTADGMLELFPQQVRIPDASFISWAHLEDSGFPDAAIPSMVPDLAVEVISRSNTQREMQHKLVEYFEAGVRLVWYVDPRAKTVEVYHSPEACQKLSASDTLTGGDVLPGLEIDLKSLFAVPTPPKKS